MRGGIDVSETLDALNEVLRCASHAIVRHTSQPRHRAEVGAGECDTLRDASIAARTVAIIAEAASTAADLAAEILDQQYQECVAEHGQ